VRDALMKSLFQLARKDTNVMLLTGDLGYGVFEEFERKYPKQYLNIGIAEQNMMGIAAGLALEGKIIFVYSIGNFPTLRCLEQIRNDACYHDLNINIVASGGGFSYGGLGMSHHATEDISIMCALPGMSVMAPASGYEAGQLVEQVASVNGPSYIRLEKVGFDKEVEKTIIGMPTIVKKGKNVVIFSTGGILTEVMSAVLMANTKGLFPTVVSMHTIKPLNSNAVKRIVKGHKAIITVEENNLYGGLGSIFSSLVLSEDLDVRLKSVGINDEYQAMVGDQDYLRKASAISSSEILKIITELY